MSKNKEKFNELKLKDQKLKSKIVLEKANLQNARIIFAKVKKVYISEYRTQTINQAEQLDTLE